MIAAKHVQEHERAGDVNAMITAIEDHAADTGIEFHAEFDDGRIMFSINRNDAPPGSGAAVIRMLLDAADGCNVPVVIDVKGSHPRLVEYYWELGFRLIDGDVEAEMTELEKMRHERAAFLSKPGADAADYGVTTMWRERHAGPFAKRPCAAAH